ncbi:hypothetical protein [Microbacterium halotolerans]|uniref:hypothetical protein n=1 Tax=Microbacterium halotolerans TaxID=246613 RepID=UPI000E6ADB85|nr:hypothetical protein [Microbacterium halotolerans]
MGRLSADQLRLHYIIFQEFRRLAAGIEFEALTDVLNWPLVFRQYDLMDAMGLDRETASIHRVLEAAYGLVAEGILEANLSHGSADYMERTKQKRYHFPGGVGDYLVLRVTTRGATLFLHAHGQGTAWATAILDADIQLTIDWPDGHEVPAVPVQWLSDFEKPQQ